jgi:hypothetical protein
MLLTVARRLPRSSPAAVLSRLQHTLTELPDNWRTLSTHAPEIALLVLVTSKL